MNAQKRLLLILPLFWLSSTYTEPSATQAGSDGEADLYAHLQTLQESFSAQREHTRTPHHTTKAAPVTPTPNPIIAEPTLKQTQEEKAEALQKAADHYPVYREELPHKETVVLIDPLKQELKNTQQQLDNQQTALQKLQEKNRNQEKYRNVGAAATGLSAAMVWFLHDNNLLAEYVAITCTAVSATYVFFSNMNMQVLEQLQNNAQNNVAAQEQQLEKLQSAQATQSERS